MIDFVETWSVETELPATRLVGWLGLGASKYFAWKQRYGQANVDFARAHPLDGYRHLTFMMLDQHVVAVSRPRCIACLAKVGLLQPWTATPSKKGTGFVQPLEPHEHWHTDISYLYICGTFYCLCSVLDGCSRTNLQREIRESMKECEVELVL